MKVINNIVNTTISDIGFGECFIYEEEVYMLICTNNNKLPTAVNLKNGRLCEFCDDDNVMGVCATVTIE